MRLRSTGEPFKWYISQPAKKGPLTSHFSRLPSDVRTNAPLRVPTNNRVFIIVLSLWCRARCQERPIGASVTPGQIKLDHHQHRTRDNAGRLKENMEGDDINEDRHDQEESKRH